MNKGSSGPRHTHRHNKENRREKNSRTRNNSKKKKKNKKKKWLQEWRRKKRGLRILYCWLLLLAVEREKIWILVFIATCREPFADCQNQFLLRLFQKVFFLSFYYVCVCVGWFIDNDLSSHFSLQRGNNHNKIKKNILHNQIKIWKKKTKTKTASIYYRNLSHILSSPSGPPFSFLYQIQFQF